MLEELVLDLKVDQFIDTLMRIKIVTQLLLIARGLAADLLVIKLDVMDVETGVAELVGVAAHRGEKEDELELVVADVGTQALILGHEDRRDRAIPQRTAQFRGRKQLITEDHQQPGVIRHGKL